MHLAPPQVVDALKARLVFFSRRMSFVQFDLCVRLLRDELLAGSILKIGRQRKWCSYFFKRYLFTENVNGIEMYNAIARPASSATF